MTNTVTGRLAKADAARTTLVEKKAAASGEHVEHAKAVAAEQKQLKEAALSEKKKALDAKAAAEKRRMSMLSEQQAKAAAEVSKAKQRAAAKKEAIEQQREDAETKAAAAEYRRAEAMEAKLTKLEEHAAHAKQVRRNKGSTLTEEELKQAPKEIPEPVQFDILERQAATPNKSPSAVQARLEARASATKSPLRTKEWDEKHLQASARKQKLEAEKAASLAKTHEKVSEVQQQQKEKTAQTIVKSRASLNQGLHDAAERKEKLLAEEAEKAGKDYAKAVEISTMQKEVTGSAKKQTREKLDTKLQQAERRRALLISKQVEEAAAETKKILKLAEANKESLEEQRETVETKAAAAEYRRAEALGSKLTKLEEHAAHAKQVRRNKGSTFTEEEYKVFNDAAAQEAVQFDIDVRAEAEAAKKSPVQARLEAAAAAAEGDLLLGPEQWTEKQLQASGRKQKLLSTKAATLARQHRKVAEVQQSQKKMQEQIALDSKASLEQDLQAKAARKEQHLAAAAEKAGKDYTKAVELSAKKKEITGSAKKQSQSKLEEKQGKASARRALFKEAQDTRLQAASEHAAQVQQRK